MLFTSGIRGKTRSLPETGGLLSLPWGEELALPVREREARRGFAHGSFPGCAPPQQPLLHEPVFPQGSAGVLGCWGEHLGKVSARGQRHLTGMSPPGMYIINKPLKIIVRSKKEKKVVLFVCLLRHSSPVNLEFIWKAGAALELPGAGTVGMYHHTWQGKVLEKDET